MQGDPTIQAYILNRILDGLCLLNGSVSRTGFEKNSDFKMRILFEEVTSELYLTQLLADPDGSRYLERYDAFICVCGCVLVLSTCPGYVFLSSWPRRPALDSQVFSAVVSSIPFNDYDQGLACSAFSPSPIRQLHTCNHVATKFRRPI